MRTSRDKNVFARNRHPVRRGFTLAELIASVAVMAILMTAMGSTMMIAAQAIPDGKSQVEITTQSRQVVDQIAGDLLYATTITEKTAAAVTFTVADRNHGTAGQETFRFAWSGMPGDPLTREYNGGTAATLIENVYDFRVSYNVIAVTQAPPVIEQPEELLSSFDIPVGASKYDIGTSTWRGQYFNPALPIDALGWSVTRVVFKAKKNGGGGGRTLVQLRTAKPDTTPAETVLEEQIMIEDTLANSMLWQEFIFSSVISRPPGEGLCLVLQGVAQKSSLVEANNGGAGWRTSFDGGAIWDWGGTRSLQHYIYGKVVVPDPGPPPSDSFLRSVTIQLQVGDDESTLARIFHQAL